MKMFEKYIRLYLSVIIFLCFSDSAIGADYEISSRVLDSFTGEFVDSCRITMFNADTTEIIDQTTNAQWGFSFKVPKGGTFVLKVEAHDYYT